MGKHQRAPVKHSLGEPGAVAAGRIPPFPRFHRIEATERGESAEFVPPATFHGKVVGSWHGKTATGAAGAARRIPGVA